MLSDDQKTMMNLAFDVLTLQAQLHIKLTLSKTNEERLKQYIRYAIKYAEQKSFAGLSSDDEINLIIIIDNIKRHLKQGVMINFDYYLTKIASMKLESKAIDEVKDLIANVNQNSEADHNASTPKIRCSPLMLNTYELKMIKLFKAGRFDQLLEGPVRGSSFTPLPPLMISMYSSTQAFRPLFRREPDPALFPPIPFEEPQWDPIGYSSLIIAAEANSSQNKTVVFRGRLGSESNQVEQSGDERSNTNIRNGF